MSRALKVAVDSNKKAVVIMDNWGNGTLHQDKVALCTAALATLGQNSKIFAFAATHDLDVVKSVKKYAAKIDIHQIKVQF